MYHTLNLLSDEKKTPSVFQNKYATTIKPFATIHFLGMTNKEYSTVKLKLIISID
jgi:hypothetical protein